MPISARTFLALAFCLSSANAAKLHYDVPCNSVLNAAMTGLPNMGFGIESSDRVGGFLKLGWTRGTSTHAAATNDVKKLTTLSGFWATAGYDVFKVQSATFIAGSSGSGCDAVMRINYSGYKGRSGWFVLPSNDALETTVLEGLKKYTGSAQEGEAPAVATPESPKIEPKAPLPATAPKPAILRVTSDPSGGVEVEMDGAYEGSTPLNLHPSDGEHTIKITKRGFLTWERKLSVKAGDERTVHAELSPAPVDPTPLEYCV